MEKLLRQHHISFKNAFAGLWWAISSQPNFRVHFVFALIALLLSWFLQISRIEVVIIICTIIFGLASEMINTALESMTDLITTEWRKEAKIAKDVAAGMMLTVALGAIIVAVIIFGPKLIALFVR